MAINGVVAVHEHLWLNNGNQSGFLAESGESGKRMGVGLEAGSARAVLADRDNSAPLSELRTELYVFHQPLAQPVKALGDLLVGEACQCPGPLVHLDAGN